MRVLLVLPLLWMLSVGLKKPKFTCRQHSGDLRAESEIVISTETSLQDCAEAVFFRYMRHHQQAAERWGYKGHVLVNAKVMGATWSPRSRKCYEETGVHGDSIGNPDYVNCVVQITWEDEAESEEDVNPSDRFMHRGGSPLMESEVSATSEITVGGYKYCMPQKGPVCPHGKNVAKFWPERTSRGRNVCCRMMTEAEVAREQAVAVEVNDYGQGLFPNGWGCNADIDCASGNCEMMGMESVCADSVELQVGWYGMAANTLLGKFPSGCYQLKTTQTAQFSGDFINWESCKGGELMVGPHICCPLAVWEDFKF